MLASMVQGKPPRMPIKPASFLVSVKASLPFSCKAKGAGDKVLYGKGALQYHLELLRDTPKAERSLDLFELPTICPPSTPGCSGRRRVPR
mmetsp:Transcript_83132/g.214195  ORF Transcript_83132/g.214195 Transcript_83132/m.214195 type:complete len:90 (-) Transcript_83132:242-511(-)